MGGAVTITLCIPGRIPALLVFTVLVPGFSFARIVYFLLWESGSLCSKSFRSPTEGRTRSVRGAAAAALVTGAVTPPDRTGCRDR